jgi:hypothetical protein
MFMMRLSPSRRAIYEAIDCHRGFESPSSEALKINDLQGFLASGFKST